jgi:hypothetical protein
MLVAMGIAEHEGKVLICKRSGNVPFSGLWEFPSVEISGDETLEDGLEGDFFGRLSTNLCVAGSAIAFDSRFMRDTRFYAFFVQIWGKIGPLCGYDSAKWVSFNKLCKFRLMPDCVTIIKSLQKKTFFSRK